MRAICRFWLIAVFCLASPLASAEDDRGAVVKFLPPTGCLPADGGPAYYLHLFIEDRAAKPETLGLKASRGQVGKVEAMAGGLFRFSYKPPRLSGTGKADFITSLPASKTSLALCPHAAGRIRVSAKPDHLLAGQGQKSVLTIVVEDNKGKPLGGLTPQLSVNVGRVAQVEEQRRGLYRAVYEPPNDPFPQVAIIMVANPAGARLERVAVGRVVIPITARVELPGKTAPGTNMQMTVAGRKFGPVRSNSRGQFKLPILVPPGFGKGRATSIDRAGNRRTRTVDLFLPETNQLGLWAFPMRLPADGVSRSRLLVTTIDRYGQAADLGAGRGKKAVEIKAVRGQVSTVRHLGKGMFEAYYTAPTGVGSGRAGLEVSFPGGGSKSRAALDIELLPGPAAVVELEAPELLALDGRTAAPVVAKVSDGKGNPVARERVTFDATIGRVQGHSETGPGVHRAELKVPKSPSGWQTKVTVRVKDRLGSRAHRVLVGSDGIARREGPKGSVDWTVQAVVVDPLGLPVPGEVVSLSSPGQKGEATSDEFGRVVFHLRDLGGRAPQSAELNVKKRSINKHFYWIWSRPGPRLLAVDLDRDLPPASELEASATMALYPSVGVKLELRALPTQAGRPGRKLLIVATDQAGQALEKRTIRLSASGGRLGQLEEQGSGRYAVFWSPPDKAWGQVTISAVDDLSQVGSVLNLANEATSP